MKKKTLESVLINDWAGVKTDHSFFKTISNDAFAGYITAMTLQDCRGEWSVSEIYNKAKELLAEGKL